MRWCLKLHLCIKAGACRYKDNRATGFLIQPVLVLHLHNHDTTSYLYKDLGHMFAKTSWTDSFNGVNELIRLCTITAAQIEIQSCHQNQDLRHIQLDGRVSTKLLLLASLVDERLVDVRDNSSSSNCCL